MNGGAYGREVNDILVDATSCCATGEVETWPAERARLHLSPQRTARRRDRRRRAFRGTPGEPAAIGAEMDRIAAAREESSRCAADRRLDLQESAGPQGLGADRRGRLPRADAGRRAGSEKHCNFLLNPAARPAPTSRRWARKCGAGCRRRPGHRRSNGKSSGWERPVNVEQDFHVAVLMGGWSAEREVSLMSGSGVAEALRERGGHRVTRDRHGPRRRRSGSPRRSPTSCSTRSTARPARTARCRA